MRKKMTARQRLEAAIERIRNRPELPEDKRRLAELYTLGEHQRVEKLRFKGRDRAVRMRLEERHIKELLAVEARYSAISRARRNARYEAIKREPLA